MKKKICWYYPHLLFMNGGTKFLYEVLKRLRSDYEITLIVAGGSTAVIKNFTDLNISIEINSFITSHSSLYWILLPFMICIEYFRARPYLKGADYIVAIVFPSNLICALYSKFSKKPYYYYCYEPAFVQNKQFIQQFHFIKRVTNSLLAIVYKSLDTWATRKAKQIFTLNEVTKKVIANIYRKTPKVTLMGVDTKHFRPIKLNYVSKKFKNKVIITHSTDYLPLKKTELALYTIAKLIDRYPQILLIITSTWPDAPFKKKYEQLVEKLHLSNNVLFSGFISYDELPYYYSASRCYLSSSYDETMGTTSSNLPVKEALACGTPAIRANITTEDVENGISGFLVNPKNIDQVAEKLEYLITHPSKASLMGKRGRNKIVKIYTWEKVIKNIVGEFE